MDALPFMRSSMSRVQPVLGCIRSAKRVLLARARRVASADTSCVTGASCNVHAGGHDNHNLLMQRRSHSGRSRSMLNSYAEFTAVHHQMRAFFTTGKSDADVYRTTPGALAVTRRFDAHTARFADYTHHGFRRHCSAGRPSRHLPKGRCTQVGRPSSCRPHLRCAHIGNTRTSVAAEN